MEKETENQKCQKLLRQLNTIQLIDDNLVLMQRIEKYAKRVGKIRRKIDKEYGKGAFYEMIELCVKEEKQ